MAINCINLVDRKAKRIALAVAIGSVAAAGGYYLASPYLAIQGLGSGFLCRNVDQVN